MASPREKREAALIRWSQLKEDRTSWFNHWKELSHYFLPRSGKFVDTATANTPNYGGKKNQHILDNTGQRSVNIATAGMLTGASSPARPWFKLRTPDDKLNQLSHVKSWLNDVERIMREVFNHTNTYRALRQMYQEDITFGTSSDIVLPNYDRLIHHYPLTIGEYALDTNDLGLVDTIYRRFQLRVSQMVQKFGYENCSITVRNMYDAKNLHTYIPVLHVIEPRRERNPLKVDNLNMPWTSLYVEMSGPDDSLLRESGFHEFRGICPRFETRGENIYGDSQGMLCLGDCKQLQVEQLRKSQGIDFMARPPIQVPTGSKIDYTPGGVSFFDVTGPQNAARSLFDVKMDLADLKEDIVDVRARIHNGFYVDLFMMLATDTRQQPPTAREVVERHEEKLLMLGPVLESVHDEMLGPLIDITFADMIRAGVVPTPPVELQGKPLSVQFISLLAQAQRIVGVSAVDRLLGTVASMAEIKPDMVDKLDSDQIVDAYADMLGVDPDLIVPNDKVAFIRQNRQQQQQGMAVGEMAPGLAKAAKDVAQAQQISGQTAA